MGVNITILPSQTPISREYGGQICFLLNSQVFRVREAMSKVFHSPASALDDKILDYKTEPDVII